LAKATTPSGTAGRSGDLSEVEDELAAELPPDVRSSVEATARSLVSRLAAGEPGSTAPQRALAALDSIGEREVRATTLIVAAIHDRPTAALGAVLADGAPLARNLGQLRKTAGELERAVRGGSSGRRAADVVRGVEERISRILPAIDADRQLLEQDNASIAQNERALWTEIQILRRYVALAARLDELIENQIEAAASDPARAGWLRDEALYVARRRHRDLLAQLTTATHAYLTLRLVERDNLEIIWSIRAASTTTVTALRTALLLASNLTRAPSSEIDIVSDTAAAWSSALHAIDDVDQKRRKTLADAVAAGRAGQ
jgi:hypothetical protein